MISKKGVTFGAALVMRPLQLRGCAQYSGPASVSWQARPGCRWRAFDLFWAAGLRAHGACVLAGGSQAAAFIWFSTRGRASERSTCLRAAAGCAPAAPPGSDPLIIAAAAARAGPSGLWGPAGAGGKRAGRPPLPGSAARGPRRTAPREQGGRGEKALFRPGVRAGLCGPGKVLESVRPGAVCVRGCAGNRQQRIRAPPPLSFPSGKQGLAAVAAVFFLQKTPFEEQ